jgi:hypothetical protein
LSAYLCVDLLQMVGGVGWRVALAMTAVDALGMIVFVWAVLQFAGRPARLVQTLTALAGTGALLGLMGLPLALQAARAHQANGELAAGTVLAWLALLAWSIAVQAHIFRHALSTRYGVGLLVAALHIVLAINLLNMIFPGAGTGAG